MLVSCDLQYLLVTYVIPEEARTRSSIITFELQFRPESAVQDVCGSGLHSRDANRIEVFEVEISVSLLKQMELPVLDLNVLCIELRVETNVWVIGVLLEVIDHPVVKQWFGLGIREDVVNVWSF